MIRLRKFAPVLMLLMFVSACGDKVTLSAEQNAASLSWLGLIDSGSYHQSWDDSSKLFQTAIEKSMWGETVKMVREPLGEVVSREFRSAEIVTDPPGQPDGRYIVVTYKTTFESKKSSIETHTLVVDPGGDAWKNAGYFIR